VLSGEGIRLQRVLARAGIGSRRHCEKLIEEGRVDVNGAKVTVQGVRVDPETVVVRVDGERLAIDSSYTYLALNKPVGMVCTMSDPEGRPCVGDLVADRTARLFHVGRLDVTTTGLLLLTNHGELAHRLAHPSRGVRKTYVAEITGTIRPRTLAALREGIVIDDRPVEVEEVRVLSAVSGRSIIELSIHEGRKHVVRRLMASVNHPVVSLARTRFGSVALGDLRLGATRILNRVEVGRLHDSVEL
jgi:23S rRNA pseudouridine2605 synthase